MQTVSDLDQHHTDILVDGEQQTTEVLRLLRSLVTEHTAADLRQTTHDLGDLVAKQSGDVFHRIIGVFHHIMQQRSTDTRATQTDLTHTDTRDGKGMHDIRLTTQTTHPVVRLVSKIERMRDDLHFLPVGSVRIVVQQRLKLALNHLLFSLCELTFLHNSQNSAQNYKKYLIYASARAFFLHFS